MGVWEVGVDEGHTVGRALKKHPRQKAQCVQGYMHRARWREGSHGHIRKSRAQRGWRSQAPDLLLIENAAGARLQGEGGDALREETGPHPCPQPLDPVQRLLR